MRLITVVLVLLITQLISWVFCAESSEESSVVHIGGLTPCPGGYCVQSYLCLKATIITDGENLLSPRIDDSDDETVDVGTEPLDDPCEEFLMRCCAPTSLKPVIKNVDAFPAPPPTCGVNYPKGYIFRVNNTFMAQFAEFPWMAALLLRTEVLGQTKREYFCGGSLIHPKVVLTAAHCMNNHNKLDDLVVRLGEWDTVTKNEPLAHQEYSVHKMIIHEKYVDKNFHNDVALLILDSAADLNKHINPICLPEAGEGFDDDRCMVSGWGKENFDRKGNYAEVLKKVELPVVPRPQCKRILRSTRLGRAFHLHSSFMCAGGEAGVDVCTGDGGSPLACKRDGSFVQAGIVAWGLGCGEAGIPGGYVKVSNFVEWIRTTLQNEQIDI